MRAQMSPEQFAQQVVEAGQVPLLVNEVVRGKALAVVLESAVVVDSSGRPVDLEALRNDAEDDAVEAYLEDDDEDSVDERRGPADDAGPGDDAGSTGDAGEARQA
jgi:trigger factor